MANSVISNLSSASSADTATQSSDRLATDKFTFLKLLVAQLENQDPLDPSDDKEFVAQLAQFSSLEQLQEINAGVTGLNDTMHQGQLMTATSFIGKAVVVSGDQVIKANDADGNIVTSYVYYTVKDSFEKGYVTIMDATGSNIIRTDTIDGRKAGTYFYEWNGKDSSGKEVGNGTYKIIIAAVDQNDKSVLVDTQFEAQVYSVYIEDGQYHLSLSGNRTVPLTDVVEVGSVSTSTTNTDTATYASLAADSSARAALAADSAAAYDESIDPAVTVSADAKKAADGAIAAAKVARSAADDAAKTAATAKEAAQSAQTAAALSDYTDALEWAEKAANFASAAEDSAASAKAKALAVDSSLEF